MAEKVQLLRAEAEARNDPEIITLQAQVSKGADAITDLNNRCQSLETQCTGTEKMLKDGLVKQEQLQQALTGAKEQQNSLTNLKESVQSQQDRFIVASRCAGWMLTDTQHG